MGVYLCCSNCIASFSFLFAFVGFCCCSFPFLVECIQRRQQVNVLAGHQLHIIHANRGAPGMLGKAL